MLVRSDTGNRTRSYGDHSLMRDHDVNHYTISDVLVMIEEAWTVP